MRFRPVVWAEVELEGVNALEAKLRRADVGQPVRRPDPLQTVKQRPLSRLEMDRVAVRLKASLSADRRTVGQVKRPLDEHKRHRCPTPPLACPLDGLQSAGLPDLHTRSSSDN